MLADMFDLPVEKLPERYKEPAPEPPARPPAVRTYSVKLAEGAKRLEGLKRKWFGTFDEREKRFLDDAFLEMERVESALLKQVKGNLEGQKTADYRKIRDLRVKMKDGPYEALLKQYLYDMYDLGIASAREELEVKEEVARPQAATQWLIDRADAVAEAQEQRPMRRQSAPERFPRVKTDRGFGYGRKCERPTHRAPAVSSVSPVWVCHRICYRICVISTLWINPSSCPAPLRSARKAAQGLSTFTGRSRNT